jgi:anti-sigma B factor antagonist
MRGLLRVMRHWDRTRRDGPLTVQVEQVGDALTVRAIGDLTRSTSQMFEAELRLVISGGAAAVDLDLGGVEVIDSTGLRSMVGMEDLSRRAGGRLRVRYVSAPVQRAVRRGGLERLLPSVDDAAVRPARQVAETPSPALRSAAMSSFPIPNITRIARSARSGSGSANSSSIPVGATCHDSP